MYIYSNVVLLLFLVAILNFCEKSKNIYLVNSIISSDFRRVLAWMASAPFLVESLIRVMYWVVAAILNRLFKPLNIKF